jgi:N-acetylmuramoyl-L-alanine amidase
MQRSWRRVRAALISVLAAALAVGMAGCHATRVSANGTADSGHQARVGHAAAKPAPARPVAIDPHYFSPGACVAFPPTRGDRHLTVFLDAGHGGIDPGAVGTTSSGRVVYEADETLPVVLDTMTILRGEGFRVVVSRTGPTTVLRLGPGDVSGGILTVKGSHDDVAARDVCANKGHANVLIGVYFNSGAPWNAGSVTAYDTARPFAAANHRLADLVQSSVLHAMNARGWRIPNGGVASDVGFGSAISPQDYAYGHLLLLGPAMRGYFNTPSQMPGALIEPLFITDPFEASIAASSLGQHVIADGLARAVELYFAKPVSAAGVATEPG